jgi:chromosome partitioning protein
MHVLAVVAQKGGVGKTSTVVHVAAALAARGVRVLVVDLDPQAAATALLAASPARGTADVLLDGADLAEVVTPTEAGVDLCGATPAMARAELALAAVDGREGVLRDALAAAPRDRWHMAVLDTPPSLGLLTVNALVAATATLTPVLPTFLSLLSVRQLEATVATVRQRLNPKLRPLGYLLCAVDARERLAAEVRESLQTHAPRAVWPQEVRVDAKAKAALAGKLHGRAGDDYEGVAVGLARRLGLALRRPSEPTSEPLSKQTPGQ